MDRPSKRKNVYWLKAEFPGHRHLMANGEIGKFLIYELRKDIDASWNKIKVATESGLLGFASKVSTRRKKPAEIGGGKNQKDDHVICVYTNTSSEDKERVQSGLHSLGYVRHLFYKTDAATNAGEYGNSSGSKWKPPSGNVIKVYKTETPSYKQFVHIKQLYPPKSSSPDILFPIDQIVQVSNAIYHLSNVPPSEEKVEGLETPDIHIWAERSQPPEEFDGRFTIVIQKKSNKKKVKFAQDDGMFCYKRLEWFRKDVIGQLDGFSSDESPDEDQDEFCMEEEDEEDFFQYSQK